MNEESQTEYIPGAQKLEAYLKPFRELFPDNPEHGEANGLNNWYQYIPDGANPAGSLKRQEIEMLEMVGLQSATYRELQSSEVEQISNPYSQKALDLRPIQLAEVIEQTIDELGINRHTLTELHAQMRQFGPPDTQGNTALYQLNDLTKPVLAALLEQGFEVTDLIR